MDILFIADLDVTAVRTQDELASLLRTVHLRADRPSLRSLERKTRHGPTLLSKSSVSDMLRGIHLPKKAVMVAFLRECGVSEDDLEPWQRAWERVATDQHDWRADKVSKGSLADQKQATNVGHSPQMADQRTPGTVQTGITSSYSHLKDKPGSANMAGSEEHNEETEALQVESRTSTRELRSPLTSQRELSTVLRSLRKESGITVDQVAEHLMCTPAKVRRIEGDFKSGTIRDVRDLINLYNVNEPGERQHLMDLARMARQQGWWQSYDLPPSNFIGLEADAVVLKKHHSSIVPGMLQTADYARAIIKSVVKGLSSELVEQRVKARLMRQRLLTEARAPQLLSILDEAVLHRVVGGPEIMSKQLNRIIEVAELLNTNVMVIPYNVGAHPAMDNNFTILEFANPLTSVVYTEGQIRVTYFDDPEDVERYLHVFDSLRQLAMNQDDSIALIKAVSEGLKHQK